MEIAHFPNFGLKGLLQFELLKNYYKQKKSLKPEPTADVQNKNKQTYLIMLITHLKRTSKVHNFLLIEAIIYISSPKSNPHSILE